MTRYFCTDNSAIYKHWFWITRIQISKKSLLFCIVFKCAFKFQHLFSRNKLFYLYSYISYCNVYFFYVFYQKISRRITKIQNVVFWFQNVCITLYLSLKKEMYSNVTCFFFKNMSETRDNHKTFYVSFPLCIYRYIDKIWMRKFYALDVEN